LLSGDLATLLAGRYVQLPVLPFSFSEYMEASRSRETSMDRAEAFAQYVRQGGFPYAARLQNWDDISVYLDGILSTVLFRDVASRQQIRDAQSFSGVVEYLADNVGNFVTPKSIADALTSHGRKTSVTAVDNYLDGLQGANVLYLVPRYNIRGKRILAREMKCYLVDTGLRTMLLGGQLRDLGRLLENVVYLELVRRGFSVQVGQYDGTEIDFVANRAGQTLYIQVALTVLEEGTLARELSPLNAVPDHYPRLLLTQDAFDHVDHSGIEQRNVVNWLLER
jgi:predicted AAA+ superfamily ATPase